MKTTILPIVRAYYDAERSTYPETEQPKTKGSSVNDDGYQRFERPNKIPSSKIDQRSMDAIRDGKGDITIENKNGQIYLARGMLSHYTSIKFNDSTLPNGQSIVLDKDVKVTYSKPIEPIMSANGTTEGHELTVTDLSGAMYLGTIRIERFTQKDGHVPKSLKF